MILKSFRATKTHQKIQGFTVAELLVASAILALLVVLLLNMVTQTSKTWRSTSGKIEEFRGARDAFDTITRRLSQATLNTYLDYDNPTNPTSYMRQSELRFLSGPTATILGSLTLPNSTPAMSVFFQAPNGFSTNSSNSILQNALNTWGYFLEYASDSNSRPTFLPMGAPPARYRYRLMELMEPTENLSIYNFTSTNRSYTNVDWISNSMTLASNRPAHVLVENVIALIILPKLSPTDITTWNALGSNYSAASLAPSYSYDSSYNMNSNTPVDPNLDTHNQLPPVIQVTMVAVDETSAVRLSNAYANLTNASQQGYGNLFQTASNLPTDLTTLGSILAAKGMNYRIFTTDVMIKGAKWSGSQTN
jgi:uncharacterized protein (TIGR02599 family)